jgi:hypothetical protein
VHSGDQWDYDAIQHLVLADIRINNRNRKVIMQANKNGYFYVLDRVNGEYISAGGCRKSAERAARFEGPTDGESRRITHRKEASPFPSRCNTSQMSFSPQTGWITFDQPFEPYSLTAVDNCAQSGSSDVRLANFGGGRAAVPPVQRLRLRRSQRLRHTDLLARCDGNPLRGGILTA